MTALQDQLDAIRHRVGIGVREGLALGRTDATSGRAALAPRSATNLDLREAQFRQGLVLDDGGRPTVDLLVGTFRGTMWTLLDDPRGDLADLGTLEDHVVIGIDGPFAWEVLGAWASPSAIGLPYLGAFAPRDDELVIRAGRTGEYGYLVIVPADRAEETLAAVWAAAAPMDPVRTTDEAVARCAFENFVFELGREGAHGLDALELQLTWRLDLHADAPGLDAIRAHREAGLRRRLTAMEAEEPLVEGAEVRAGDRSIGRVLAAVGGRALAVLDLPWAQSGMTFEVDGRPATTRSAPFVTNRSLFVNPQRHSWATRDEIELPPDLA
ncbi:MAG: hypothetical protein H6735_07490 [Alphaproteobacteria bacterium]|nr:hypothetical protein [Alphaproteobacteria bacterium]